MKRSVGLLIAQMILDDAACTNCGIDHKDCPNGALDADSEPIRWRRTQGYLFCSDGCEAVYLDFVKEHGHGN